ncbi:electron transport complex subunit RsxC [Desulfosudis oleivorans]|uniref:Ion-translocating oxidoreductase complex subunit C n=1 Tax=Desulfosudis oleivorans (strain DSM 6200 / JCM 39069 / Hxd3) TaxID=96561 RepID=A8ZSV2_DESOH|nr:electron transport complex subunit RsxC [Desulfosudis oleivorans]ABW66116.1 electron transport complex, RnfABCDGE type, C subunit [Desulfosudis oleivorans Hxd3]
MGLKLAGFEGSGTFAKGVHPPGHKNFSQDVPIEVVPTPAKVVVPLMQNIGAPSECVVKAKQDVTFGEMIAKATGFVSVPIHSPINGKVQKVLNVTLPNGRHVPAVPIKADGDQLEGAALMEEILGGDWPKDAADKHDPKAISEAISAAGIVGLGGAAFPTHVKIMPNDKRPVDALLINGCECEPFLTPDYRIMVEAADAVICGALLAGRAVGAKQIVVGIEANKPKAVEAMTRAAQGTAVKIAVLKTKYPQGSEKHLIMAVMKRKVPPGKLPLEVGAAVSNVGTVVAVARAVLRKKPLTHRVVCVTGGGIVQPKNLLVPIGISYGELIEFCGGLRPEAARIVSGGPMMGFAFTDMEMPVTKGASGVTVLTRDDVKKAEETACVRCGRCVDVCPLNLVPSKLAVASRNKNLEVAERYNIFTCLECGCCAYTCPASLPLVQLIRMGKAAIMATRKK